MFLLAIAMDALGLNRGDIVIINNGDGVEGYKMTEFEDMHSEMKRKEIVTEEEIAGSLLCNDSVYNSLLTEIITNESNVVAQLLAEEILNYIILPIQVDDDFTLNGNNCGNLFRARECLFGMIIQECDTMVCTRNVVNTSTEASAAGNSKEVKCRSFGKSKAKMKEEAKNIYNQVSMETQHLVIPEGKPGCKKRSRDSNNTSNVDNSGGTASNSKSSSKKCRKAGVKSIAEKMDIVTERNLVQLQEIANRVLMPANDEMKKVMRKRFASLTGNIVSANCVKSIVKEKFGSKYFDNKDGQKELFSCSSTEENFMGTLVTTLLKIVCMDASFVVLFKEDGFSSNFYFEEAERTQFVNFMFSNPEAGIGNITESKLPKKMLTKLLKLYAIIYLLMDMKFMKSKDILTALKAKMIKLFTNIELQMKNMVNLLCVNGEGTVPFRKVSDLVNGKRLTLLLESDMNLCNCLMLRKKLLSNLKVLERDFEKRTVLALGKDIAKVNCVKLVRQDLVRFMSHLTISVSKDSIAVKAYEELLEESKSVSNALGALVVELSEKSLPLFGLSRVLNLPASDPVSASYFKARKEMKKDPIPLLNVFNAKLLSSLSPTIKVNVGNAFPDMDVIRKESALIKLPKFGQVIKFLAKTGKQVNFTSETINRNFYGINGSKNLLVSGSIALSSDNVFVNCFNTKKLKYEDSISNTIPNAASKKSGLPLSQYKALIYQTKRGDHEVLRVEDTMSIRSIIAQGLSGILDARVVANENHGDILRDLANLHKEGLLHTHTIDTGQVSVLAAAELDIVENHEEQYVLKVKNQMKISEGKFVVLEYY